MSHLPEAQDDFIRATQYNFRTANKEFQDGNDSVAYRYAMEFVENALKVILVNNCLYIDRPKWQGGDRHHSSEDLWNKIKQNNLINPSDEKRLNIILPGLFKVDISSQSEHIDCASEQTPGFRYKDMDDFVNHNNAKDKIDLMNQAMNILQKYLKESCT